MPAGRAPAGARMVTTPPTGYEKINASRFMVAVTWSWVVNVTRGAATAPPNRSRRSTTSKV